MRCVIAQPTFLPWIGWFDLMDQADQMVLLDDVQFSKQSWQNRNRIRTQVGLEFITIPVRTAGRQKQLIIDCEIVQPASAIEKLHRTLLQNYSKAPFFTCAQEELENIFTSFLTTNRLVDWNIALISFLARWLGVRTPMVRSSTLPVTGKRGAYVARLCEAVGAIDYLSTVGAEAYLAEDRGPFDALGIGVWIHQFEHPSYKQRFEPFLPYASALDLVLNTGSESGAVMRSGRQPFRPLGPFKSAGQ